MIKIDLNLKNKFQNIKLIPVIDKYLNKNEIYEKSEKGNQQAFAQFAKEGNYVTTVSTTTIMK